MEKFQGKKWRCVGTKMERDYEVWWAEEYKVVKEFQITKQYKSYLFQRREKAKEDYIATLKEKLENQYKDFGEVDPLDYQEYLRAIGAGR